MSTQSPKDPIQGDAEGAPERKVLRILGLVDLHWSGRHEPRLPRFEGYDLVLLAGDLTNFLGSAEATSILDPIAEAGVEALAVCGNCDRPEMEELFADRGLALDRTARIVRGVCFAGLSGGLPFGGLPYERTEEEYDAACAQTFDAIDKVRSSEPVVLVSHQPPFGTQCDLARGQHVGSRSIRRWIEQRQPHLVFSGHIHESIAIDRLGSTQLVNPGPWFQGNGVEIDVEGSDVQCRRLEPGWSSARP